MGDSVYCTERGVTCQDVLKELDLWVTVCNVQREEMSEMREDER